MLKTVKPDAELVGRVVSDYEQWKRENIAIYLAEERQAATNRKGFELAREPDGATRIFA